VSSHELVEISDGWQAAASAPGECRDPSEIDGLEWHAARVPGTAADVLIALGGERTDLEDGALDEQDWWFRTALNAAPVPAGEELVLILDGVATVSEVYIGGRLVHNGDSMFSRTALDVTGLLDRPSELVVCSRALGPLLRARRGPRARWRTRLVADGGLRFWRTMLIGRAPGFAPGPPVVGPWREIRLECRRALAVDSLRLRPKLEGDTAVLGVHADLRALGAGTVERVELMLSREAQTHEVTLALAVAGECIRVFGELRFERPALWWPHTHGQPALYDAALRVQGSVGTVEVAAGRIGFRTLRCAGDLEADGLALEINGTQVFARGAVWTPLEASGPAPNRERLRALLETAAAGGLNMLRIPGTAAYESLEFHDLCDELGILVWQDFMFANLDYPESLPDFMAAVESEATDVLARVGGRASLAVLCGSSEVAQQVAMLGLDPNIAFGPLFGELLPRLVSEAAVDAVFVPSAPWGGFLPFRPARGVANYYGVGGYRRPLEDARRADVRFAAECLAVANVPGEAVVSELAPDLDLTGPRWKRGVPRDVGSDWDFEDVRDHYLHELFGLDPAELRANDPEHYLELSRTVSGEVMAEVFGEWRRAASSCRGGLVLWLRDLRPGAGWGILDHDGEPKVAYHHLRRALAPQAVWGVDEGLGGIVAHVANDSSEPLAGRLRAALYRDLEVPVGEATVAIELAAHSQLAQDVEEMLGRFVDVSYAYRFGEPQQDVVALTLERESPAGLEIVSQAFRLPAGRPLAREASLGLAGELLAGRGADELVARLSSRRFAYGVRFHSQGLIPADDAFSIEPGGERLIGLRRRPGWSGALEVCLSALNLRGEVVLSGPHLP